MERGGCYWAQGSIISPDIGNGGTKNSRRSSRIFFRTFFRGSGEYGGLRYDIAIHGSRRSSRKFFGTTFRFAGGGESEYRYYLEVDCATYSEGQRLRLLPRRRRRSFFGIAAGWAGWIYSWLDWACAAAGAAESAAIECIEWALPIAQRYRHQIMCVTILWSAVSQKLILFLFGLSFPSLCAAVADFLLCIKLARRAREHKGVS